MGAVDVVCVSGHIHTLRCYGEREEVGRGLCFKLKRLDSEVARPPILVNVSSLERGPPLLSVSLSK